MIKFSHSIFALPFAFSAALLAENGVPSVKKIFWITVAMVSARSAAMGANRIIDREIDALNPRTKNREIPAGIINVEKAALFSIIATSILILSAYMLNPLCLKLSPIAIAIVIIYSYTKRFTWLSHIVLGIAISFAPLGAWIAVKGSFSADILPLVLGVIFWLAGFDILYALQDVDFDRQVGLYSIPKRFGIANAILIGRVFHIITWLSLALTGVVFGLGYFYFACLIFVGGLLVYEHLLVKEDDLSRLNIAFLNMNGYISAAVFVFTLLDILIK